MRATANVPHTTPINLIRNSTLCSQTDAYFSLGSEQVFLINQTFSESVFQPREREDECVFGFKSAKELICVGGGRVQPRLPALKADLITAPLTSAECV